MYKGKRFNGLTVPHGWGGLRKLTIMVEGKEAQVTSHINGSRQRDRESLCRETLVFKTIRSHETYSFVITRTAWERPIPIIQSSSPGSLPQHVGIMGATRWDLGGDKEPNYITGKNIYYGFNLITCYWSI